MGSIVNVGFGSQYGLPSSSYPSGSGGWNVCVHGGPLCSAGGFGPVRSSPRIAPADSGNSGSAMVGVHSEHAERERDLFGHGADFAGAAVLGFLEQLRQVDEGTARAATADR